MTPLDSCRPQGRDQVHSHHPRDCKPSLRRTHTGSHTHRACRALPSAWLLVTCSLYIARLLSWHERVMCGTVTIESLLTL